jgi:GNAT superfamily N-acetyltransferase
MRTTATKGTPRATLRSAPEIAPPAHHRTKPTPVAQDAAGEDNEEGAANEGSNTVSGAAGMPARGRSGTQRAALKERRMMTPTVTIIQHADPPADDLAVVYTAFRQFNDQQAGRFPQKALHLLVYSPEGTVIGGLFGAIGWGWLHLDILWVADAYRGQGLGTQLLQRAEAEATAMGVMRAYLETTDFQAYDFYARHGYVAFAVLDDQPPGHQCFYMQKTLA